MDVLELLGSVNKVSIFFFILTLGVLGYEFYLFQKEKKKKEKPKIPTFNPSRVVQAHNYTPAPSSENEKPTVTGVPIESITPTTPPVGGPETTTGTPTVTLISTSASATLTPTKAAVASVSSPTPTTPQTLPVAATVQPQLFILLLGALTVFFSILY